MMERHTVSYGQNSRLAAYQSAAVHGQVAEADPHRLVLVLMDAIMERLSRTRGYIERGDVVQRTKVLHSCVTLIGELRGSLNLAEGGEIAQNLSSLYEYMVRRLLVANLQGDAAIVAEVASLLGEVRGAWVAIGPAVKGTQPRVSNLSHTNGVAAAQAR